MRYGARVGLIAIGVPTGILALYYVYVLAMSCRRPASVPEDAVCIHGVGNVERWYRCEVVVRDNRCQIYRFDGEMLVDDVYIPYDSLGTVLLRSLTIDTRLTMSEVIWLKNGRILVPKTHFEQHRESVERMLRLRSRER